MKATVKVRYLCGHEKPVKVSPTSSPEFLDQVRAAWKTRLCNQCDLLAADRCRKARERGEKKPDIPGYSLRNFHWKERVS